MQTIAAPWHQSAPVVNYPNEHDYTRVTEFKYLPGQEPDKTTIVYEYPRGGRSVLSDTPTRERRALPALQGARRRDATPGVTFVGRLATYKYCNMDQVVAQALATFARMTGRTPTNLGDLVA